MRKYRMEKVGAVLGIATGVVALTIASSAGLFLSVFGITEFGGTHAIWPLIGPGWSGVLYAATILASGLLALRRPFWGGKALFVCALIGLLFGTTKYLIIECLSLVAAVLCLLGWWKSRAAQPLNN